MRISFWEKITGLNKEDLNQGEFELINRNVDQEENFFDQLEKSSSYENAKDKEKNELAEQPWMEDEGQLTVDVYQTPDEIIIQSTIAGVKKKDLDIALEEDMITIKGERMREETKGAEYLHQECFWGKFSRSIVLPQKVKQNQIKACLKSGILTVILPKTKKISDEKSVKISPNKRRGKKLK